jgi:hypothetical protein
MYIFNRIFIYLKELGEQTKWISFLKEKKTENKKERERQRGNYSPTDYQLRKSIYNPLNGNKKLYYLAEIASTYSSS